ncbi:bifunctional 4-hydroxy-2-oxoglutarate aldolase/2-dehydro-3-deoxy-phosphogluconate aldolase [Nakamurella lactea]|uniref:bifunctional 4-hydroxy-2-oxoglutarate aldolase/2-dehydro-3-deoxy-phosphogluconate aldolase n=1 Tax=Nakamurella lactea TaxID=459515 RepID=UPI0003FB1DE0|nr:bifunctional 4-hydroxy-2-oxoglutarate aldolase/2-dehydro-3-deoxy-phosphogluconate aldolase [Nakamurella lactea]
MFGWHIMEQATRQRVIGIVRTADAASAVAATETLLRAGLESVEVTLTNPAALEAIANLRGAHPDALIGAGSVLDGPSAVAAVRAGARFLVSPTLSVETIRAAARYGVPTVVGTATPTEMLTALEAGAAAVKLFPASNYTPRWISDVRAALPQLPIVPTGGVTPENAREWLDAGAVAVGLGSALTKGDPEQAEQRLRTLLADLAPGA